MSDIPVRQVIVGLCQACIDGLGHECHTPGCILWLHTVDLPIHEDLLHALPPAMTWTREMPVKEGWYWWRVRYTHGEKHAGYITRVYQVEQDPSGCFVSGVGSVDVLDGEWAGPMEPPQ